MIYYAGSTVELVELNCLPNIIQKFDSNALLLSNMISELTYVPVKSNLKHPPPPRPPGIPRAFDVFSCPGGREFDELSLPRGGHLITTHRGDR